MKTLADLKRRMAKGVQLVCVASTHRPELAGRIRVVDKVQANGFTWRHTTDPGPSWTFYPKAASVTLIDADTFCLRLVNQWGKEDPDHTVTMRFHGASASKTP